MRQYVLNTVQEMSDSTDDALMLLGEEYHNEAKFPIGGESEHKDSVDAIDELCELFDAQDPESPKPTKTHSRNKTKKRRSRKKSTRGK
jgi:hypothetical protein